MEYFLWIGCGIEELLDDGVGDGVFVDAVFDCCGVLGVCWGGEVCVVVGEGVCGVFHGVSFCCVRGVDCIG